jgi:energy-coupling factor transporter ATP-binding protein EcfA2
MTQIALDHVDKVYRGGLKALDDLNLAVADGEFVVLLGPSGCGKSTALRSIAGLEEINGGTISIRQRRDRRARHPDPRDLPGRRPADRSLVVRRRRGAQRRGGRGRLRPGGREVALDRTGLGSLRAPARAADRARRGHAQAALLRPRHRRVDRAPERGTSSPSPRYPRSRDSVMATAVVTCGRGGNG